MFSKGNRSGKKRMIWAPIMQLPCGVLGCGTMNIVKVSADNVGQK